MSPNNNNKKVQKYQISQPKREIDLIELHVKFNYVDLTLKLDTTLLNVYRC